MIVIQTNYKAVIQLYSLLTVNKSRGGAKNEPYKRQRNGDGPDRWQLMDFSELAWSI